MAEESKIRLEDRFATIEEILHQMEAGEVSLDETFDLYKRGVEEIKQANAMLDGIEREMLVLNEEGKLEEF